MTKRRRGDTAGRRQFRKVSPGAATAVLRREESGGVGQGPSGARQAEVAWAEPGCWYLRRASCSAQEAPSAASSPWAVAAGSPRFPRASDFPEASPRLQLSGSFSQRKTKPCQARRETRSKKPPEPLLIAPRAEGKKEELRRDGRGR